MRYIILGMAVLMGGCAVNPETGRNEFEELRYQMQCTKYGVCPPPADAPYEQQLEYAKLKAMHKAAEAQQDAVRAPSSCNTVGGTVFCQ